MPLAYDYPLLGVFWSLLMFSLFVLWIVIVIWCFIDNFRRSDHHGFAKALWADPERAAALARRYPLRRLGEPEDVAGIAVMLASRAGNFITGQTVVVDGGGLIGGGE